VVVTGREIRLKETDYAMKPQDSIGDIFPIASWISNCRSGGFIDYDGFGHYATLTEESSIMVYPSDVKAGKIRNDFTHVIWYNR